MKRDLVKMRVTQFRRNQTFINIQTSPYKIMILEWDQILYSILRMMHIILMF